jgi:hypothetical protein
MTGWDEFDLRRSIKRLPNLGSGVSFKDAQTM